MVRGRDFLFDLVMTVCWSFVIFKMIELVASERSYLCIMFILFGMCCVSLVHIPALVRLLIGKIKEEE